MRKSKLDFDDLETQANMLYVASHMAEQAGLPILSNFLQCQAQQKELQADVDKQDDLLRKLEVNSLLLLEHKAA